MHSTLITSPVYLILMAGLLADVTLRSKQADDDADLFIHMVETTCEIPVRYAALLMLVRSLAVRLDFDMSIPPSDLLALLITAHTATLFRVAKHILGLSRITDPMLVQMQLPGQYGCMFLTNPLIKLQVAHLASMAASLNHTSDWLRHQGFTEVNALNAMNTTQATALLEDLRNSTIFLAYLADPVQGCNQGACLILSPHLFFPIKTLQGRLSNVLYRTCKHRVSMTHYKHLNAPAFYPSRVGNGAIY